MVENIPKSKHAIAITADNDANILIHVGLDTVELDGNGFDVKVANGAKIKKGDLLMTFNLSGIKKQGYKMITPMVVCNADEFAEFKTIADGDVNVGDNKKDGFKTVLFEYRIFCTFRTIYRILNQSILTVQPNSSFILPH